jgi:hypothetical protein
LKTKTLAIIATSIVLALVAFVAFGGLSLPGSSAPEHMALAEEVDEGLVSATEQEETTLEEPASASEEPIGEPEAVEQAEEVAEEAAEEEAETVVTREPIDPDDRFVEYAPKAWSQAVRNGRAVIFINASWCQTCRAAAAEFQANLDQIPDDVTILDADWEAEPFLRWRYKVEEPHEFIQVDSTGRQLARWSGGGLAELHANLE